MVIAQTAASVGWKQCPDDRSTQQLSKEQRISGSCLVNLVNSHQQQEGKQRLSLRAHMNNGRTSFFDDFGSGISISEQNNGEHLYWIGIVQLWSYGVSPIVKYDGEQADSKWWIQTSTHVPTRSRLRRLCLKVNRASGSHRKVGYNMRFTE